MNQENKQLKTMLEAEKQEFLTVLSHGLRTPMTVVKGYLDMILQGDAGELNNQTRQYIAAAYVGNERGLKLVENMMKVVDVQEQRLKFNLGKVDLAQTVQILIHDFELPAKEKDLKIIYHQMPEPIFVLADPDRVREILLNLISNAVKFTKKGSITISHRTILETQGRLAVVDVTDTGIGIAKEYQSKIFNIFTKENLNLAGQEKGTGLGLFLSGKLAEAQNGKVWLEKSVSDEGSTFSAAFPIFEEKK